ncbi:MAG: hypothetical protein WCK17_09465, partial [Verrucomicrobiota bacterium]
VWRAWIYFKCFGKRVGSLRRMADPHQFPSEFYEFGGLLGVVNLSNLDRFPNFERTSHTEYSGRSTLINFVNEVLIWG